MTVEYTIAHLYFLLYEKIHFQSSMVSSMEPSYHLLIRIFSDSKAILTSWL